VKKAAACAVRIGRPREFDVDQALDAVMRVFWCKGFEGTSLGDLTDATGISRPSLYLAFGNKEALFKKALERYTHVKLDFIYRAIEAPTARGVAEGLLRGMLAMQTSETDPKGCMGVINSVACGAEAESSRADVLALGLVIKNALIARFQRARDDGDLSPGADPVTITVYLIAILQGTALQAGAGAGCQELKSLIDGTLALWPKA
jgi:AcrR family transcriptional regulator